MSSAKAIKFIEQIHQNRTRLTANLEQYQLELTQLMKQLGRINQALELLQVLAEELKSQAQERIAHIVTQCLRVFGPDYSFRIDFDTKRGRSAAAFVVVKGGVELDPVEECGGGLVDVIAFALRVATLLAARPHLRRVVILDEPFRFVSIEFRPKIAAILGALETHFKVQFILVTHLPELSSERSLRLD